MLDFTCVTITTVCRLNQPKKYSQKLSLTKHGQKNQYKYICTSTTRSRSWKPRSFELTYVNRSQNICLVRFYSQCKIHIQFAVLKVPYPSTKSHINTIYDGSEYIQISYIHIVCLLFKNPSYFVFVQMYICTLIQAYVSGYMSQTLLDISIYRLSFQPQCGIQRIFRNIRQKNLYLQYVSRNSSKIKVFIFIVLNFLLFNGSENIRKCISLFKHQMMKLYERITFINHAKNTYIHYSYQNFTYIHMQKLCVSKTKSHTNSCEQITAFSILKQIRFRAYLLLKK
eukprot:TRINITY_DN23528_c0_g3_i2.p1 TRINITY_DN23528_c0_g3~~TRINITY_DN23528_c0_g3_i2.p1  ORF type:complete len:318 (-),score=-33.40 TRINITY_DN23528_c0_g3_i2:606-1454(-)